MGTQKKLLLEVADRIGIDDEIAIFTALGELGLGWKTMAEDVHGTDSALALLTSIAAGTDDANIAKVFKKIGAEKHLATLQGAAARLTEIIDKLPGSVRKLLNPVGSFDETKEGLKDHGLIHWPIAKAIGAASDISADKSSYSLSLGAAAAITIEAGASWPYSDTVPGPLLRLRAEGSLKPKASGTIPFGASAISATASGSAACAIEYFFAVSDPGAIYALSVGERLPRLVDPFDFDAVWNGFATSDLAGIHYEFDGSAALEVAVSLADAGMLGAGIQAEIGATITVGFGLEGKYFLTFRAGPRGTDGTPQIIAALSREKKESSKLGINLGGTIDLGALATKLHAILAKALAGWDKVLQEITPYLSPGTLLRERAGTTIDALAASLVRDADLQTALAADLRGIIGTDTTDESALAKWLGGQLTGALDASQGWAEDQAAAADRLLDNLGRSLPSFARAEVREKLEGAAKAMVHDASDELRIKVQALFDDQADALGKALKKVGAVADKHLASADAALAGVRDLIGRYDALFQKMLAATEDAARAKISIAVQIEESRLKSQTMEVAGVFLANSASAKQAFRALTQGDFTALIGLMDGKGTDAGFMLDPAKSSLKRYASSTGKFGIEMVMLGFGVTGSELLSGEASVMIDGTGKVQVDAKGRLAKRFTAFDAEREIVLVSSFALVRARALVNAAPAADRSMGLAVTIGHIDDRLERHEVERFVGSLVDKALVVPSALALAQRTFTDFIGNPGSNGKLSATLQLKFGLDRGSLSRLLCLSDGDQGIAEAQRRLIVRRAYDILVESDPSRKPLVDEVVAMLCEQNPRRSLDDLLMDHKRTRRSLEEKVTGSHIPRLPDAAEPFCDAMDLANGMLEMVTRLRAVYFSRPELRADNDPLTWSPGDYRDAERGAVKAVQGWLQLNSVLFWTNSKVHHRTIAFLQTLSSLAGVDPLENVSLTIWRKNFEGRPETVVLSHANAP